MLVGIIIGVLVMVLPLLWFRRRAYQRGLFEGYQRTVMALANMNRAHRRTALRRIVQKFKDEDNMPVDSEDN